MLIYCNDDSRELETNLDKSRELEIILFTLKYGKENIKSNFDFINHFRDWTMKQLKDYCKERKIKMSDGSGVSDERMIKHVLYKNIFEYIFDEKDDLWGDNPRKGKKENNMYKYLDLSLIDLGQNEEWLYVKKVYESVKVIQKYWDVCRYNPEYNICRKIFNEGTEKLMNIYSF